MTDKPETHQTITKAESSTSNKNKRGNKLYLAIWRWHFYAGLLCIPVTLFLGVTGIVYLFKPYLEPWLYQDLMFVQVAEEKLSPESQLAAAVQAFPNAKPSQLIMSSTPTEATQVSMRDKSRQTHLVFVNPYNGEITGSLVKSQMLMRIMRDLHGKLLMGSWGSALVELTACWLIILILTGFYLWWPHKKFQIWGVFLPRLRLSPRLLWRDLHALTGVYASILMITLLVTGLPWTLLWGGGFHKVQAITGQSRPEAAGRRISYKSTIQNESNPALTLSQALNIAVEHQFTGSFTVHLPKDTEGVYGFTQSRPVLEKAHYVYIDQYSGEVLANVSWKDYPPLAKLVSIGVRLHQGEWFGVSNLILMLIGSLATIWMCISGGIMWWKRRPTGKLGVPLLPPNWKIPKTICYIIVAFALFFPLVGISLVLIWLLEKYVLNSFSRLGYR